MTAPAIAPVDTPVTAPTTGADPRTPRPTADEQHGSVPIATAWTRRLRTFIPWQLVRFAVINVRMLRLIRRGHGQ